MSKELETLKKLKDRADHDEYLFRKDTNKEKAIKFLDENNSYVSSVEQALKKHEQYKAIEQDFGVGLNVLLKDVHNPIDFIRKFGVSRIWFFDEGKLQKADIHNLDCNKDALHLLTNDGWYTTRKVSDYGKTWALTKEELENGR